LVAVWDRWWGASYLHISDIIKKLVKLEIEMARGNDQKTDQITNGY